jgi:hypothetical protein
MLPGLDCQWRVLPQGNGGIRVKPPTTIPLGKYPLQVSSRLQEARLAKNVSSLVIVPVPARVAQRFAPGSRALTTLAALAT